jgi:hypothetical protein
LAANPLSSSKEIHDGMRVPMGYATVKRVLQVFIDNN